MCGIAGVLGYQSADLAFILKSMADPLSHRGPDASGVWTDAPVGVGLAHRRLSILDLSAQGSQPMVSDSGRYVISYNGEVYNHRELRAELDKSRTIPWRGHSDTEILLSAIEHWGVRTSLERSNGMFAFAVWDRQERKLTLARDRMGEKPLYLGWIGATFGFASELSALRRLPGWMNTIDRQALGFLLRFGYVPAPLSIHRGIFKLPAATFVTISEDQAVSPLDLNEFVASLQCYWSLPLVAAQGLGKPFPGDDLEAVDTLQALLEDAVRMRMIADVPVGCMLSGGIDSSLISALMQRQSAKPVRTFTIGFHEDRFDEAKHARKIADHIGSDHTEFTLLPECALDVIPRLPEIYDEPFADASQLPTILVSAIARQHVVVALSGDGGDELFHGYGRYMDAYRLWRFIGWCPGNVRAKLAAVVSAFSALGPQFGGLGFRVGRLANRIKARTFDEFYENLLSLCLNATASTGWPTDIAGAPVWPRIPRQLEQPALRMMYTDQSLYLPENILTKVDRASMASSLELRVPLLDHRVVEFSWTVPHHLRFDGRDGKVLLRRILYRLVPRHMVERPKHGFEIPLDEWLRKPLRSWMLDLLDPAALGGDGFMDHETVTNLVSEHLTGRGNHGYALWPVLMFQAWLRCHG